MRATGADGNSPSTTNEIDKLASSHPRRFRTEPAECVDGAGPCPLCAVVGSVSAPAEPPSPEDH